MRNKVLPQTPVEYVFHSEPNTMYAGIQLVHLINPDITIPIHYDDYDAFKSPLKVCLIPSTINCLLILSLGFPRARHEGWIGQEGGVP